MSTNFNFNETTFLKLYKTTLSAFPNTSFRQHVVDVIEVKDFSGNNYPDNSLSFKFNTYDLSFNAL